jgi:HAE1 family hydrophobic/amphiphilic exporter-1
MYMLMVALFESLLYPLMIMFSLPLAVAGAIGLLAVTGNTINMLSLIGMILLAGLVGKNAILLVDYTNTLRKRGLARDAALQQAGPTRLRPILLTSTLLTLVLIPAVYTILDDLRSATARLVARFMKLGRGLTRLQAVIEVPHGNR